MVLPLIIGFSGPAGSGKDEATQQALQILESVGVPAITYSFAFPLKQMCQFIFGMTEEEMTDRDLKEQIGRHTYGMTNRRVMQLVGTESFREVFNENIWVDVAERNILQSGAEVVIISDVRFENEARWVKENGFLIHIDPAGREGFEEIEDSGHASEAGYETAPTVVINNNVDLGTFQAEVVRYTLEKVLPVYRNVSHQAKLLLERMQGEMVEVKREAIETMNFGESDA